MRALAVVAIGLIGATLTAATPLPGAPSADVDQTADRPLLSPYLLAQITRGEAITKVVAVGTVQPAASVVVGSQVSGQVKDVLVDYNDTVRQGQPIAQLDQHLFATRVEQARAEVEVTTNSVRIAKDVAAAAVSAVARAEAEHSRTEAEARRNDVLVNLALRRLERRTHLMKSGSSSASDLDDARAAYETAVAEAGAAKAQVASRRAQVEEAKGELTVAQSRIAHAVAQVERSKAALRQAVADLSRTVIRAPTDGIIIERSVSAGQTVAASFQAPSLFTVGDLRAVSVEIAIDEADIGRIRPGQETTFAVDAYPDRIFAGRITQVRKAPHTQENVVTYTVIAAADNKDLLLFPGMTAKAEIITGQNPEALQVPTAALRYRPAGIPQPSGSHVWVFDGEGIRPVAVRIGASEADRTEIAGAVEEGQSVVVGEAPDRTTRQPGVAWRQIGVRVASWMEPMQALTGLARR